VKVTILAVGKLREAWVSDGCAEYEKRLRGRLPTEVAELRDDAELLRRVQALRGPRVAVWALDERGQEWTSDELAAQVRLLLDGGTTQLLCLIGGADGLPAEVRPLAQRTVSLSRLTLPHRIARLLLVEQLYRATTILRGEPYHRA
jgi:23S rRNA (pseudouridine1915-N3)-methyltransferase